MRDCLNESPPYMIGGLPWNYADFGTQASPMRSGDNCKGLFTRDRNPKTAANYFLRENEVLYCLKLLCPRGRTCSPENPALTEIRAA